MESIIHSKVIHQRDCSCWQLPFAKASGSWITLQIWEDHLSYRNARCCLGRESSVAYFQSSRLCRFQWNEWHYKSYECKDVIRVLLKLTLLGLIWDYRRREELSSFWLKYAGSQGNICWRSIPSSPCYVYCLQVCQACFAYLALLWFWPSFQTRHPQPLRSNFCSDFPLYFQWHFSQRHWISVMFYYQSKLSIV